MTLLPLNVRGAVTRRRGKILAGPIDVRLEGMGITIVIGPNGSGKTSLLRMLHGIARLSEGGIEWACPMDEARKRQAFVFQRPVVLHRSVLANVAFPLRLRGVARGVARERAMAWVRRVGLDEMADRPGTDLSGGESQKLAIARALVIEPDLVFLDEPCASLDGSAIREIEALLLEAAASGTRIVMSTHDMGQARRLADEIWFLHRGRLHESGPAANFLTDPQTPSARAFLNGDIVE
ncbi:Glutamine transport ATP-binding protein GlnQ [Jannaschia aquimarina]|uniref:GlnQ_1 protein n=1 Tax=Jannaschia aquimarina TaxID=935700 RepID=A0A0D1CLR3_9RHOB|nr:Glutamine transport ATP-binding protein GlnQ [Jannaschia aquimarina]SNT38671.1 tungstate transport system ATP-binding protein [Jannaschia aquimarina]